MTPHLLTNFEIQAYYQNEPRFISAYSRDNLPDKIKDGAYVINLDEYSAIGPHWIALYVNNKTVTYFDSFRIEHILKLVKNYDTKLYKIMTQLCVVIFLLVLSILRVKA